MTAIQRWLRLCKKLKKSEGFTEYDQRWVTLWVNRRDHRYFVGKLPQNLWGRDPRTEIHIPFDDCHRDNYETVIDPELLWSITPLSKEKLSPKKLRQLKHRKSVRKRRVK